MISNKRRNNRTSAPVGVESPGGPDSVATERVRPHIDLSEFDGQRMAVILDRAGKRIVLRGTARFVRDESIGNSLRIRLDQEEPGEPILIVSEATWDGRIIPDLHFGCSYCLIVE